MPDQDPEQTTSSLSLPDLYYIVFRRKWIILGAFVLGLLAVVGVYFLSPPRFQSEAKLMVKYLLDNTSAATVGGNADVRSLDVRSEAVIAAEMEVLRSHDLALEVANTVSSQLMPSQAVGTNMARVPAHLNSSNLTLSIIKDLSVASPKGSTIIMLNFESENSDILQPVLRSLISAYFKKHNEIHRPQVDNLKIDMRKEVLLKAYAKAETNLFNLKSKYGIISVEESRKALAGQMSKLEQDIFTVETDLSERRAIASKFETSQSTNSIGTNLTLNSTNVSLATTNSVLSVSNALVSVDAPGASKDLIDEYQQLANEIKALKTHLSELRTKYRDENAFVLVATQRLSDKEKRKAALELAQPSLVNLGSLGSTNSSSVFEISSYKAQIAAMENRLDFLTNQLALVKKRASAFETVSYEILQAEHQRDLAETNYFYLERILNQTTADKDIDSSKAPNINVLQEPTVSRVASKTLIKRLAMAFAGCFGAGIALVLLLELVLDQTVKTSRQIESKLHLTTLMTIPKLGANGSSLPTTELPLLIAPSPESNAAPSDGATSDPAASGKFASEHPLRPYLESLRDRVGVRLENVARKPKLVGVTNFDTGAGATSLATGLAATLSETGEGKVLYVDMNPQGHALHPFFHGKPATLDDLLNNAGAKPEAEQKLHVVSALNEQGWGILPRKFSSLIPKLVASEYDYIIFDLPAFTPTSVTPLLARMLDTTLVVVEAEKTRREAVQKAGETLKQYKADFAVVLNKQPNYVPKWLHHEF